MTIPRLDFLRLVESLDGFHEDIDCDEEQQDGIEGGRRNSNRR
jgi:hypothetical protein